MNTKLADMLAKAERSLNTDAGVIRESDISLRDANSELEYGTAFEFEGELYNLKIEPNSKSQAAHERWVKAHEETVEAQKRLTRARDEARKAGKAQFNKNRPEPADPETETNQGPEP